MLFDFTYVPLRTTAQRVERINPGLVPSRAHNQDVPRSGYFSPPVELGGQLSRLRLVSKVTALDRRP